jgi:uncharacterized membrane-anchored protein
MKYIVIGAFAVMVSAHWIVPLSMIRDANRTIGEGAEYKFKTAPIDPTDPFRGKYITLDFDLRNYYPADTNETHFAESSTVYALLGRDSTGYAKIKKLFQEPPVNDDDYIAVTYLYGAGSEDPYVSLSFPFTTFYLEESKASDAEQVYWQSRRDNDSLTCYAKVKVFKGDAKLLDVMVNDSSIVEVVKRLNKNR